MKSLIILWIGIIATLSVCAQDQTLIPFESNWKYLDNGSNQGTAWRSPSFIDTAWASGPAKLGYGEGDENTVVSYGANSSNKHITTYFRHTFQINDISLVKNFLIKLIKDDGALVYVNGQNVMRSNFGTNNYNYKSLAYSTISGSEETIIWEEMIDPSYFQNGSNTVAVEVHQVSASSSDLSFDLELIGFDNITSLYRLPYIQMITPTSAILKWKTDIKTNSRVFYGKTLNNLNNSITSLINTVNHEVLIPSLDPDTKYYYKIGDTLGDFTNSTASYFFRTSPPADTPKQTRLWITGDAGTGKSGQLDVRDAYLNYVDANGKADLWLLMGDNAYEHGREADYHMGLFNVYDSVLRNTPVFPTSGNHDFYGEANPITGTGPYFDIFAIPTNGECGGEPSGTEAYYSYNYGNIHFVSLESYGLNRDSNAAMATWLKNDLQNTTAKWLIAYWHYAPYTKVGHDSDDPNDHSGRAIEMRTQFNPILERFGVDLVLSGHSHGYERSFLINGHYGFSSSLQSSMKIDSLSGKADVTGVYRKSSLLTPNEGTVYMVCGSSGKLGSTPANPHPVMYNTNAGFMGSVIIDIAGDTLESKFLNENGAVQDYFHIVKKTSSTSINEPATTTRFNVFPNPFDKSLYIKSNKQGTYKFTVSNIHGAILLNKSMELNGNSQGIASNTLSAGIYFLKIWDDKGSYSHKIIKMSDK